MKIFITTKEDLKNLQRLREKLQPGAINEMLDAFGVYMVGSVRKNFEQGGRPKKWQALKPATLARKRGESILVESGALTLGIDSDVDEGERAVYIGPTGPSTKYAGRHNNPKPGDHMPQRELLLIQDEDEQYFNEFCSNSVMP